MAVTMQSNLDVVLRQIRENTEEAAKRAGEIAVDAVHEKMLYGYTDVHGLPDNPHTEIVDTGKLFDSITAKVRRVSQNTYAVSVGTNIPYAIWIHEGTRKIKARPFITHAMQSCQKDIEDALGKVWKKGF